MINFSIKELNAFAVIGQEVELTNYQKKNIKISTQFWRKFNSSLKKAYLSQSGNWVKYAFMERRNGKLYYFCSIPHVNSKIKITKKVGIIITSFGNEKLS